VGQGTTYGNLSGGTRQRRALHGTKEKHKLDCKLLMKKFLGLSLAKYLNY